VLRQQIDQATQIHLERIGISRQLRRHADDRSEITAPRLRTAHR
jgi:hypothetical protein